MKDEIQINYVIAKFNESIDVKKKVSQTQTKNILVAANAIITAYKSGNKLLICGNGGSAADAQHIAAELVHQFELKGRHALPAIALSTNTSILTAIGNDWGYNRCFERQVEALANKGDIVLGISTSGNSVNVISAFEMAKKKGAITIGLLGKDGGKLKSKSDIAIIVPSDNTAVIQESHMSIYHIICGIIDRHPEFQNK